MAPGNEVPDEELVARVAAGDRTAYALLVERHADRQLGFACRVLSNREAAEDVVQEAFLKLWTHAGRFNPAAAKFTTWFYRVVMNRCLDVKRRKRPVALPEDYDAIDDAPVSDEALAAKQRAEAVRKGLDGLPERQRVAVSLFYFEGLRAREAAEVMEVGIKAFESLLVRARKQLAKDLQGFDG